MSGCSERVNYQWCPTPAVHLQWDQRTIMAVVINNAIRVSGFWTECYYLRSFDVQHDSPEPVELGLHHSAEQPVWYSALRAAVQTRHLCRRSQYWLLHPDFGPGF